MKTIEIQNFLLAKGKFLPMGKIDEVTAKLQNLVEGSLASFKVCALGFKSPLALTLLYWFVPGFALVDRFFVEGIGAGLKKLFILLGLCLFVLMIFKWSVFDPILNIFNESDLSFKILSFAELLLGAIAFIAIWIWLIGDGIYIYIRVKKQNLTTFNNATK